MYSKALKLFYNFIKEKGLQVFEILILRFVFLVKKTKKTWYRYFAQILTRQLLYTYIQSVLHNQNKHLRTSTGQLLPEILKMGQCEKQLENFSLSTVALIKIRCRSERLCKISLRITSKKSDWTLLSCTQNQKNKSIARIQDKSRPRITVISAEQ